MAAPVKPADEDPLMNMETYNSQEFVEYLNEIRYISGDPDEAADDETPPEEGEEEWEWLKQTGFDSLVSVPEPSADNADEWNALDTLSQRQADVVKRRVATLRDTLRQRRTKEKGRRPDMRHLFPAADSTGTRSRSATPDSLDSLSPPPTPPDARSRLDAGSPHSQGYHSSSRGSLDQLAHGGDDEKDGLPEFRHVLRISLDQDDTGSSPAGEDVQMRQKKTDATDRALKSLNLFETTGNYKFKHFSTPADSSGIEVVSFHALGSVRHQSERSSTELGGLSELHIPRVRSGSKSDTKDAVKQAASGVRSATTEGRLGRTLVDYLSEPDVKRLQKLALIELTALFDEHGLSYSRRKARRKRLRTRASSADGVFGVPLTLLLERDRLRQPDGGPVPLVLERVLGHLERRGLLEEGLLRVPGHQQKVELLRRLVDAAFYSRPGDVDAALRRSSAADVAALVKLFLRELPRPLLTGENMDAFHGTDALPPARQPAALTLLCLQLPAANRAVLRRLLAFMAAVAEREQSNKMSLENVSMIMAPNLLWPGQRRQKDISVEIEFAAVTSRVVRNLVRHRDRLWEVPAEFIRQLRSQYESEQLERARKESNRPMKKLLPLRKKEAPVVRKIDNEMDFQDGVIRVTAPQFSPASWPVQLTPEAAAGDVVTRCVQQLLLLPEVGGRQRTRRGSSPRVEEPPPDGSTSCLGGDPAACLQRHFLYEHGGNIGQRRIEHDAAILECYHENPNGRWVIHCCHASENSSSVEIVAE